MRQWVGSFQVVPTRPVYPALYNDITNDRRQALDKILKLIIGASSAFVKSI